jgi:C-terminal processing protease CtpA/Prc
MCPAVPVVGLVLTLLAQAPAQASRPDTAPATRAHLTRAEMESDLDALLAGIRARWSYLEDKSANLGVDPDALVAAAKAALPEVASKAAFHEVVSAVVAALKDGHAGVFTHGVAEPVGRWPIALADSADGVVVAENEAVGLPRPGDRVLSVESVPIETAIALAERTTMASTDGARRALAISRLTRMSGGVVTLTLAREDGSRYAVSLPPAGPTAAASTRAAAPSWSVDHPRPGVARLRVRSFAIGDWTRWLAAKPEEREGFLAETKKTIDACFERIAGSAALVIDLRGNGGGTDLLGIHLARHLVAKRFVYFQLSARRDGGWSLPHGYEHDPVPAARRFDGPLALVVDERCFSTTDNFLRAVIESRDGVVVVGRPTNGGTGAPDAIAKLPNSGTSVTLCTQRVYGPKGTLIEGRGTRPTIAVRWTAADYREGRDPDLAAALAALESPGRAESRASTR